ncbi:MAG: uracil-DNA glycosylase [Polyangiaceae bacterium]
MDDESFALPRSWQEKVGGFFAGPEARALAEFLRSESRTGTQVHPAPEDVFAAFAHTPFEAVRVVILGQDPYHGPGQAHGLAFSVPPGVPAPPSLVNVFKELERDLGIPRPRHGCLTSWAEQGVLLLNDVLTVRSGVAASHQGKGWEAFTDRVIATLDREHEDLVFMLWGSHAQKKGAAIDGARHLVLRSVHPSPLSAHRGFLGCGHFSKTNEWLRAHGRTPVDWSLPQTP